MTVLHNLFPIPVMFDNIGRNFSKEELEFIFSEDMKDNIFNLRSKNSYVLDNPKLQELKKFVEDKLNLYFQKVYKPKAETQIYLTQSWINLSKVNERHHIHRHPNSFVSGTLYISADRSKDNIVFARADHSTIKIDPVEYNHYNSPTWFFNIGPGDILLFPSDLDHYVEPIAESNLREHRISLSFNSFLKGTIGSEIYLSELKL